MTPGQIALLDIGTNRLITLLGILKAVPSMGQEEVDATTAKFKELKADEMAVLDSH